MKFKDVLLVIFGIIILVMGFYIYSSNNEDVSSNSGNDYSSISVKTLVQNSQNYIGKNVSIKGTLNTAYDMEDDYGYQVHIGKDKYGTGCTEGGRNYDYFHQTYTAYGTWNGSYLICTQPLE